MIYHQDGTPACPTLWMPDRVPTPKQLAAWLVGCCEECREAFAARHLGAMDAPR